MILLLLTFFFQAQPPQIIFESQTRGSSEIIIINQNHFRIEQNGIVNEYLIDPTDWDKINKLLKTIDYDKMSSYPAPTNKRNNDAAWHSTLSVQIKDQRYTSTVFDDTNAPKELSALMNKIIQLKKKLKKN